MQVQEKRVDLWRDEYHRKGIPSSFRTNPSGSVELFVNLLETRGVVSGHALDIGCGTGRNSLYLAFRGFRVSAMDFVPEMVDTLRLASEEQGFSDRIMPHCHDVAQPWPLKPNTFDLAVDAFCYKHQIAEAAKNNYRNELKRVLKPNGYYMLTLAGSDDGYYGPFLSSSPDPARRVIVDPANEIQSILYSKEDVLAEFSPDFELRDYKHKQKQSEMHGEMYDRSTHLFIFTRKQ